MQEGEAQLASQPEKGSDVGLLQLLSNEGGNPSVYHSGNGSHAARRRKDKGGRRFSELSEAVVLLSVPAGIVKRSGLLTTSLRVL